VTSFLVESYTPATAGIADVGARARSAGSASSPAQGPVRYVRSILVPADETCFHLFEATSAEAVRQAIERVGVSAYRIIEAQLWGGADEYHQSADEVP
jgi:hypothetical protein